MLQQGDHGMIREDRKLVKTAPDLLALCDEVFNEPRDGRNREEDAATHNAAHVWPIGLILERGSDKAPGGDHRADYVAYPVDDVENGALNLGCLLSLHRLPVAGALPRFAAARGNDNSVKRETSAMNFPYRIFMREKSEAMHPPW